MDRLGDHDGKSKSASRGDVEHYPNLGEGTLRSVPDSRRNSGAGT
jgi:hypothetical protein